MSSSKYIGTKETARLTGLSINEVYNLIHEGTLLARKAPKSGWRISPQDLADLGLIKGEPAPSVENSYKEDCISYVEDEEHYTKVFKRMTEVKHSLKIATANIKNFYVPIEMDYEKEMFRLCDFFMSLVERGVYVQVVCMKPFGFYNYTKENCPQLLENPLFELRYNEHNHMKIFIFDNEYVYMGSANITPAAIGKRTRKRRNHEAGMLMWGPIMTEAPLRHFEKAWNDSDCIKHTWKRFTKLAKEYRERY